MRSWGLLVLDTTTSRVLAAREATMRFTGERQVRAPVEHVWAALHDGDVLRAAIPGCEALVPVAPGRYAATLAARVGPVADTYRGDFSIDDAAHRLAAAGAHRGAWSVRPARDRPARPASTGCPPARNDLAALRRPRRGRRPRRPAGQRHPDSRGWTPHRVLLPRPRPGPAPPRARRDAWRRWCDRARLTWPSAASPDLRRRLRPRRQPCREDRRPRSVSAALR